MFQTYAISWMIGRDDPREDRDRTHRVAIREAQITTEYRESAGRVPRLPSLARRFAFSDATAAANVDLAACCA